MAIKRVLIRKGSKPEFTPKEKAELEALRNMPDSEIVYDEDAPYFTEEEYREMAKAYKEKMAEKKKPVVSLRISPDTLRKAKATGRGYTGFLSRLLDNAINDPEIVAKSLK